jgi:hypothetical protein
MAETVKRYEGKVSSSGGHSMIASVNGGWRLNSDYEALAQRNRELARIAQALVDGMETCHECKGTVLVDEYPVHCEDCTSLCDHHEGAECATIYGLHLALKRALLTDAALGGEEGR